MPECAYCGQEITEKQGLKQKQKYPPVHETCPEETSAHIGSGFVPEDLDHWR
jgi:hypothetical protein